MSKFMHSDTLPYIFSHSPFVVRESTFWPKGFVLPNEKMTVMHRKSEEKKNYFQMSTLDDKW